MLGLKSSLEVIDLLLLLMSIITVVAYGIIPKNLPVHFLKRGWIRMSLTLVNLSLILMMVAFKFVRCYMYSMLVLNEVFSCLINPVDIKSRIPMVRCPHSLRESSLRELTEPHDLFISNSIFLS